MPPLVLQTLQTAFEAAAWAAYAKLGPVEARNCDRDDLRCLNSATTTEAAAFARAASVQRAVARTLAEGKCKAALVNRARAQAKHRADVLKARSAWRARDYQAAARYYYAEWAQGGRFDGLFLRYC